MIDYKVEDIYKGEDFWAQGEYLNGYFFIHCSVFKNNKTTIKKAREMFKEVIKLSRDFGYTNPILTYTQNPKFCKIMGGEFINTFCVDGRTFEVWKWE